MKKLFLSIFTMLISLNLSVQAQSFGANSDGTGVLTRKAPLPQTNAPTPDKATLPFSESFESGNYDNWVNNKGSYSVTNSVAQDGSYSLTSSTSGSYTGLTRYFEAGSQPTDVSIYIRSGATNQNDAYFAMTGEERTGTKSDVFFFYAQSTGKLTMIGSTKKDTLPYNANQWYHIEIKNINWTNKQFDYYVDGNLIEANMGFRGNAMNECYALHVYNHASGTTAYWDNIVLDDSPPMPAAPDNPTSLTATSASQHQVDLTWSGTSNQFRVLQKTDSSSSNENDGSVIYEGTGTSVSATGLDPNKTYFFSVFGMNTAGDSFSDSCKKAVASTLPEPDSMGTNGQAGFLAGQTDSSNTFTRLGIEIKFTAPPNTDGYLDIRKILSTPIFGTLPGSAKIGAGGNIVPTTIYELLFWRIINNGLASFTYQIIISLDGIAGIGDPEQLCVFKRTNPGDAWDDAAAGGATIVYDSDRNALIISGLASFSEFAIGSAGGDNPLPVELTSFSGTSTNAGVRLNWTTASEADNAGFVLYRNGEKLASYKSVDALKGQGISANETHYRFVDSDVALGESYTYKITSVDRSGTTHEYVQTVSLSITEAITETPKPNEYALQQNYPNPFNPATTITYSLKQAGKVTFRVFDMLGREVYKEVMQGQAGENEPIQFKGAGLNSGVYFYQIQSGAFSETKKMMLLK